MPRESIVKEAFVCCQCNRHFNNLGQFYKTYSGLYSGTGYLPICRSCLSNLYDEYLDKYESKKFAMQRLCMAFDLYYDDKLFDNCCDDDGNIILGQYIKMLNMKQYKGKTFDFTLFEKIDILGFTKRKTVNRPPEIVDTKNKNSKPEQKEEPNPISKKDIEKWGYGFDVDDYSTLNSHYNFLTKANPNCDSNQEIFINDLCITKMLQMKAVKNGDVDAYNKLTESYRKSFQQAGLKTVKDASATEDFSFGVNCEMIEKYTPAEYYKNKELYKDHDNLGSYYQRFILRPLRNLIHGTKDRDAEFYVKDEGDTNDTDE